MLNEIESKLPSKKVETSSPAEKIVEHFGKNTIRITPKETAIKNLEESPVKNGIQAASFRRKMFFVIIWLYKLTCAIFVWSKVIIL